MLHLLQRSIQINLLSILFSFFLVQFWVQFGCSFSVQLRTMSIHILEKM
jgi:hypothetical protein